VTASGRGIGAACAWALTAAGYKRPAASYLTGQKLRVDGGLTRSV